MAPSALLPMESMAPATRLPLPMVRRRLTPPGLLRATLLRAPELLLHGLVVHQLKVATAVALRRLEVEEGRSRRRFAPVSVPSICSIEFVGDLRVNTRVDAQRANEGARRSREIRRNPTAQDHAPKLAQAATNTYLYCIDAVHTCGHCSRTRQSAPKYDPLWKTA